MSLSPKKRFNVLKRFNFQCFYCGRRPPEVELQVDHQLPLAVGGEDDDTNLVAACWECNIGKGASIIDDDIVFIYKQNGEIDHEKSLKRNGLWKSFSPEIRMLISSKSNAMYYASPREFRASALAWFRRRQTTPTS
jgi:HNH endonuclease